MTGCMVRKEPVHALRLRSCRGPPASFAVHVYCAAKQKRQKKWLMSQELLTLMLELQELKGVSAH